MASEILIGKEITEPRKNPDQTKEELYRKYFCRKIIVGIPVLSFLFGVTLIVCHVVLLRPLVSFLSYPNQIRVGPLDVSGLGIIAGVTSIASIFIIMKTYHNPTYAKILLTFLTQLFVFCVSVGLIVVACTVTLIDLNWMIRRESFCPCVDADGNIERNGTDPTYWSCVAIPYSSFVLKCVDQDNKNASSVMTLRIVWTMICCGAMNAILVLVPTILALRTLWSIHRKFDALAQSKHPSGETEKNLTLDVFNDFKVLGQLRVLALYQLGFICFTLLYMLSRTIMDSIPYQIAQIFASGSVALIIWASSPNRRMNYIKLSLFAAYHIVSIVAMLAISGLSIFYVFGPRSYNTGFVFYILEMILSIAAFIVFIRPITNVDKFVEAK